MLIMRQQRTLMKFDPATGHDQPYPSEAQQWRDYHGVGTAWLFNPWLGVRRIAEEVGSDPFGHLIIPPGEPVCAETADYVAVGSYTGVEMSRYCIEWINGPVPEGTHLFAKRIW